MLLKHKKIVFFFQFSSNWRKNDSMIKAHQYTYFFLQIWVMLVQGCHASLKLLNFEKSSPQNFSKSSIFRNSLLNFIFFSILTSTDCRFTIFFLKNSYYIEREEIYLGWLLKYPHFLGKNQEIFKT